jgi:short-subunit dehydrogenase
MNTNDNYAGKTVLITGASSGIGRALAREFAKHQFNIIAVALHDKSLTALKNELLSNHRIEVETVAIDLTDEGAPAALYDEVKNRGYNVDILVNDAGVGQHGYFVEGDSR